MKLTNRDLQKVFKKSLVQIKRWAGLSLGRDPQADQGGGVRREYSQDDAFIMYLFGAIFVGQCRMQLQEAKIHIDNIKPILISEGLLPSLIDVKDSKFNYMPPDLIVEINELMAQTKMAQPPVMAGIDLTIGSGNSYLLEKNLAFHLKSKFNDRVIITRYKNFGSYNLDPGPEYYIPIIVHISIFNDLVLWAI
jgi:hypothetical protein